MKTAPRRIRSKLENGDKAYGIAVQLPSPEVVEAVGYAGYDFAWIDADSLSTAHHPRGDPG